MSNKVVIIKTFFDRQKDGKIHVSYKSQISTNNEIVVSENCNSIMFHNAGDTDAIILDDVPLNINAVREFNNEVDYIINQRFQVKFITPTIET